MRRLEQRDDRHLIGVAGTGAILINDDEAVLRQRGYGADKREEHREGSHQHGDLPMIALFAMRHFIFPADPLNERAIDEFFEPQRAALMAADFTTSLLPDKALHSSIVLRNIPAGSTVVYRGWMIDERQYSNFVSSIAASGATAQTSTEQYLLAHHLPNWYPKLADLTPETVIYDESSDFPKELTNLGWPAFFLKDYVKSLKTGTGSLITDPRQAAEVIEQMRMYRGSIEGGICVRRVEPFVPDSELRYFVRGGRAYSANGEIPPIVSEVATRIDSPFFSVDIAMRDDGVQRVVEIGDGQVSDLVGWTPEQFAAIW